jgi:alkylation response protein AidB-like acyl-CoA dehydrogenase
VSTTAAVVSADSSTNHVSGALDRIAARDFSNTHIASFAGEYDRTGRIPADLLTEMSRSGLWAPFLPAQAGGSGVSMVTVGAIHEEVGRACSSVRSLLTVHAMVTWAVHRWGNAAQRERWLPGLASGTPLGAFCLTEPQAGSDASRIETSAAHTGRGWALTGVKRWITGAQVAGLFLVFARTSRGVAAFLVPRDARGLDIKPIDGMLGTRASMLAEVHLRGVVVGSDALLGPDGFPGGMVLTGTLDIGRYSVAAGAVGITQACLDACVTYTSNRTVGAGPLRDLQLIRAKITDMVTDAAAGRLLYEHAGRLKDLGDESTIMATFVAKYFAAKAAARHASEAVQIHGANGVGPDYPVARYYRDAKVMEIIEGSSEIQQLTIADAAYRRVPR